MAVVMVFLDFMVPLAILFLDFCIRRLFFNKKASARGGANITKTSQTRPPIVPWCPKKGTPDDDHHAAASQDSVHTSSTICNHTEGDGTSEGGRFIRLADSLLEKDVGWPCDGGDVKGKCAWLRSQIIGNHLRFQTPFGQRQIIYADHTASGRSLHFIEDFIIRNVLPYYGNTHTEDSFVGKVTSQISGEATRYVKSCMGGRSPDDAIFFCGTGCTGAIKKLQEILGIGCSSLLQPNASSLPEEEHWVVFIGPYEHHSNILSWRQSLAEVVEIPLDKEGGIDLTVLKMELERKEYKKRPKLGCFSACSNVTGLLTDTRVVARILHEHGAFVCFDFAASAPYVPMDMQSGTMTGYDAIVLSPHKFMGGPGTPGILLMTKDLYFPRHMPPSMCGGGVVHYVNSLSSGLETVYVDDVEEREDAGSPGIIQKVRAALAFWMKEKIGCDLIEYREDMFMESALLRFQGNPRIKIIGSAGTLPCRAIMSFLVQPGGPGSKHLHCRFVVKLLNDLFGVQARGGCSCAGPYGHALLALDSDKAANLRTAITKGFLGLKPGWSRLSFGYYISQEEFEYILSAVEFVAEHGNLFLALYDFKWETGDWIYRVETGRALSTYVVDDVAKGGIQKAQLAAYLAQANKWAEYLKGVETLKRDIPKDIDPSIIQFAF